MPVKFFVGMKVILHFKNGLVRDDRIRMKTEKGSIRLYIIEKLVKPNGVSTGFKRDPNGFWITPSYHDAIKDKQKDLKLAEDVVESLKDSIEYMKEVMEAVPEEVEEWKELKH